MRIELPFTELETFINKAAGRPVQVKCTGKDTVEVHYIVTVTLSIAEVRPHGAVFNYSTNGIVGMMVKGMKGKIREELSKYPFLSWEDEKEQIAIDLDAIPAAKSMLAHAAISSLNFEGEQLVLGLRPL
jgi:hypothetical protein